MRQRAMLRYRSMRKFVRTREKCGEAQWAGDCFSTLLECSYKFPSVSITQHSMLTSALFIL